MRGNARMRTSSLSVGKQRTAGRCEAVRDERGTDLGAAVRRPAEAGHSVWAQAWPGTDLAVCIAGCVGADGIAAVKREQASGPFVGGPCR